MRKTEKAKGFKNLTNKKIWVYSSEGELVELPPENKDVLAAGPEYGVFYIVEDEDLKAKLEEDSQYRRKMVSPIYMGTGRSGKPVYHIQSVFDQQVAVSY